MSLSQRTHSLAPTEAPAGLDLATVLVVVTSVAAGMIHLYVVPEHLDAWRPAGAFFALVGVAQLVLAVVVCRPRPVRSRLPEAVALVATVGLVVLYVASRTVDLPLVPDLDHGGPHLPVQWGIGNGTPVFPGDGIEEVGPLDVACLAVELVTIAALCSLVPAAVRRRLVDLLLVAGVGLVALRVTGVLG